MNLFYEYFLNNPMLCFLEKVFLMIFNIMPIMLGMAFLTLSERKILAFVQSSRGPSNVGIFGFFQPLMDGLKLLLKNLMYPYKIRFFFFLFSPILTFMLSLLNFFYIPLNFDSFFYDLNYAILFFYVISGFSSYGMLLSGWSSNSKYAMLGSMSIVSQMMSYEMSFGLILLPMILSLGSFNLTNMVYSQKDLWNVFLFFPLSLCFFMSSLAETNSSPFLFL